MAFPTNPSDGDTYTTSLGTLYRYHIDSTAWKIVSQEILGNTGIQGVTGAQGATGIQGNTGVTGGTGLQGPTGIQGVTGVRGMTGIQGNTGVTGNTGLQGPTGFQGVTGIQGQTGITGLTGVTGTTGLQGPTGDEGAAGAQGETGIQGQTGLTGVTGLQGPAGDEGAAGAQGATGLQGPAGDEGAAGAQGATGLQGPAGDEGAAGAQGETGIQGVTGLQGTQGDPGDAGAQGETGVTGPAGAQGATGIQGVTGLQGIQGATGIQGVTGVGIQGQTGIQGVTGSGADIDLSAVDQDIIPSDDITYDIGSPANRWLRTYQRSNTSGSHSTKIINSISQTDYFGSLYNTFCKGGTFVSNYGGDPDGNTWSDSTTFGNGGYALIGNYTTGGVTTRRYDTLFRWDLLSLDPSITVTDATVQIRTISNAGSPLTKLQKMTTNWGIDSTYAGTGGTGGGRPTQSYAFSSSVEWADGTFSSADYTSLGIEVELVSGNTWYSYSGANLIGAVQNWVEHDESNFGVYFKVDETNASGYLFYYVWGTAPDAPASTAPKLIVTYNSDYALGDSTTVVISGSTLKFINGLLVGTA